MRLRTLRPWPLAFGVALVALGLAAVGLAALAGRSESAAAVSWDVVDRAVAAAHPSVPSVSTGALADRLAGHDPPVVLDARTPAEFAVSHIAGARRVDPDATPAALADVLRDVDREGDVVVYCSVGVRSARVVGRLRALGFERASNLEGSVFRWANEGRPVVRDGHPVREVHPYDAVWGRLLRVDLRAPVGSP